MVLPKGAIEGLVLLMFVVVRRGERGLGGRASSKLRLYNLLFAISYFAYGYIAYE